jgi:copper homeostasis protein (lipoprotein)
VETSKKTRFLLFSFFINAKMKKIFLFLPLILVTIACTNTKKQLAESDAASMPDMHTSRIALDWQGVYRGIHPCADCEGIRTQLVIADSTYQLTSQYLSKSDSLFVEKGTFSWLDDGNTIVLYDALLQERTYYKVGENQLRMLDKEGKAIDSQLASMYILHKETMPLENKTWSLISMQNKFDKQLASMSVRPFILFSEGNKIHGSGGCNRFFGSYTSADNDRISFSAIGSTRKACIETMKIEDAFFAVLQRVESYKVQQDTLKLRDKEEHELAVFYFSYFSTPTKLNP